MKTLEVIAIETKKDKNNKEYSKITLSSPSFIMQGTQKIRIEPKVQSIVKYAESYLEDGSPQFGHDFQVGEFVAGSIETVAGLLAYPITDAKGNTTRMATSSTHVVLGNSDNELAFEAARLKEFNSRGCYLASDPTSAARYVDKWGFEPVDSLVADPVTTEAVL